MTLPQEKILHLRKLTALAPESSEISIDSVLGSFDALRDLEIPPGVTSTRSGAGSLIPREDIIIPSVTSSDDLLACSSQRVVGHQIALSSIMHGE